jgi:glycosyl transferase family 25
MKGSDPELDSDRYPVFVLSLEGDTVRRAPLLAKLDSYGVAYRVHRAIDGRAGLPAQYQPLVDRSFIEAAIRRRVTDGELACALSHRAIYQRIVDENLPGAIILEDDARIARRFVRFVAARGYLSADLVLLDHHLLRFSLRSASHAPGPCLLLRLRRNACLTTGYSVSHAGAKHILASNLPLRGLADWPCDITALGAVAAVPRLVGHPPFIFGNSHIKPDRAKAIRQAKSVGSLGRFE